MTGIPLCGIKENMKTIIAITAITAITAIISLFLLFACGEQTQKAGSSSTSYKQLIEATAGSWRWLLKSKALYGHMRVRESFRDDPRAKLWLIFKRTNNAAFIRDVNDLTNSPLESRLCTAEEAKEMLPVAEKFTRIYRLRNKNKGWRNTKK